MQITPKYNITLPCPGEQGVLKKGLNTTFWINFFS